ncbi:YkgJ family cysteine cluster protein [Desulfolithobacter sp.]
MNPENRSPQTGCLRCGSCCEQGGPALHTEDLALLESGRLHPGQLVTVRRGELALAPLGTCPEPVQAEFLKVQGRDGSWRCCFFDRENSGCAIYDHRPLACRILECWEPGPLLDIAGRDLLNRFACIADDDPLLTLVRLHESQVPCPDLSCLSDLLKDPASREARLHALSRQVQLDLMLRDRAVREHRLSVALELFYFGRPLFQLLKPLGIQVRESGQGVVLHYEGP